MKMVKFLFVILALNNWSCGNRANQSDGSNEKANSETISDNKDQTDSIELFFHSKGVISLKFNDKSKMDFDILNSDKSIFAVVKFSTNTVVIEGEEFLLSKIANDKELASKLGFIPKEFFPDYSVVQFEYTRIIGDFFEVYIDKSKEVKKLIKRSDALFKNQIWIDHLKGCVVDFKVNANPIRTNGNENSKSLGYENAGEDYIFVIQEVKGDWIKIQCAEMCDFPCNSGEKYDGWIKWKEKDNLLVRLSYAC